MDHHETKKLYTDWLRTKDWTYFFTGTFRGEGYTCDGARRAIFRFFRARHTKPEFTALFIERGTLYGRVHVHGLLLYPEKGLFHSAEFIRTEWERNYGFARVETPKSRENISGYCTKYVTKHLNSETYFFL